MHMGLHVHVRVCTYNRSTISYGTFCIARWFFRAKGGSEDLSCFVRSCKPFRFLVLGCLVQSPRNCALPQLHLQALMLWTSDVVSTRAQTILNKSDKASVPGSGSLTLRVHVPNNWVLRVLVIVVVVQILGKYMIIRYLDP